VNDFENPTTEGPRQRQVGRSPLAGASPAGLSEHAAVAGWPRPGLPMSREASRGARKAPGGWAEGPDDVDGALGELPSLLARSASGLEFIYKTLELIAARYRLRDLLVVVEGADKPQIFRLRRAPLATERVPLSPHLAAALTGHEGLYADPPVVGPVAAACVTSLVELALRLDLLVHDASHDALTGLLNRRSYELLLLQAVSRARRYGWPFALVLLDLDNFKVVNDRYGHAAGDTALKAVGAELRASLRAGDVAARLGGDEFALLVVGVENVASLSPLLGRLKKALERSVPETNVSFSVGVACFPSDTDDPEALTGLADARLYAAKAAMEYR
jgi:diguanylate cyclase (GGDEF)-like protein